jgi:hypothetical protein
MSTFEKEQRYKHVALLNLELTFCFVETTREQLRLDERSFINERLWTRLQALFKCFSLTNFLNMAMAGFPKY